MKIEENVCVQEQETEQVAVAKQGAEEETREEKGSAVMGKFKDVNALMQAYGSLQAEFTRRSQRLKELEREVEHFRREQSQGEDSGAEKLRKNAQARREREKKFDEFLAEMGKQAFMTEEAGKAVDTSETLAEISVGHANTEEVRVEDGIAEGVAVEETDGAPKVAFAAGNNGEQTDEVASGAEIDEGKKVDEGGVDAAKKDGGENPLLSVAGKDVGLSSQAIYEQACRDESVRFRIIGEYLASIGKTGVPLTVGGIGIATPPLRAKSIEDAGEIALRYFKKQ